jgi:hypothetical protein
MLFTYMTYIAVSLRILEDDAREVLVPGRAVSTSVL